MMTEDPVDGLRGVVINTASVAAFDGQLKDNTAPPPYQPHTPDRSNGQGVL